MFLQMFILRNFLKLCRAGNQRPPVPVKPPDYSFDVCPICLGGFGVFHDFTNISLVEKGFDVPVFSSEKSRREFIPNCRTNIGLRYMNISSLIRSVTTEILRRRKNIYRKLSAFIRETLEQINLENTTFILTSDHGNIEDLSIRNHTLNDVPTIIWGRKKEESCKRIKDLSDITPSILHLLTK